MGSSATTTGNDEGHPVVESCRKDRFARSRRPRGWFEAVFLIAGFVLTMLTPQWIAEGAWAERVTAVLGWALLIGGCGVRLWASMYIGGHKSKRLTMQGPYSVCRNPLYLGSVIIGAGFALLLGSGVMLLAVGAVALDYALYLVPHEERRLLEQFGNRYRRYRERTPMLWPRWRAHRTRPMIRVHLRSLGRELRRACVLALAGLAAELFVDEWRGREIYQMVQAVV